jgi:hypothetical protein
MNDTQLTRQQKWLLYLAAQGCPTLHIAVRDSESASFVFAIYRYSYGLGASDIEPDCENVYDASGTVVAHISYNRHAWNERGELMHEACHQ